MLIRLLRWVENNPKEWQEWYEWHLDYLKDEGIMHHTESPEEQELYSYAILMLHRITDW